MTDSLSSEPRLILRAKLEPTAGSTIQPTGFPDLGAAEFERPRPDGGTENAILVESVQSLANHLERVGWYLAGKRPVRTLAQLPYVAVHDTDGNFLTSSRLEPHRLAGAYIREARIEGKSGEEWLIDRTGVEAGRPMDWPVFYSAIFALDPLCLLHGVFFSSPGWKNYGNPKIRRSLTAVIEAHGARPAVSGGVKRDDVNPTKGEGRGSSEGFGFVPFGRTEYTAEEIELSIVVDLEQIRGFGLGEDESDLLVSIALWEVRSLLDRPLRLRTACDLQLGEDGLATARPTGWELPPLADLEAAIQDSGVVFDGDVPVVAEFDQS